MNIVFDLGGVVFEWHPDKIISSLFDDEKIKQRVKTQIFQHPDWLELDRGTLPTEQAIQRGADRTKLSHEEVRQLFDAVPQSLTPFKKTIDLIHFLKTTPNKLYVLSNMHYASMNYLEKNNSFWHLFDGKVFSCQIHKIKPEPEIYQHLLDEYKLTASETIFIDDMPENLQAAAKFGIKTIQFINAEQCRQELINYKAISS